jgi:hypothetical protein
LLRRAKELIDDASGQDWLSVRFLVWLKCTRSVSQVNGKVGDLKNGVSASPVLGRKGATLILNNDFAGESKVTVEPCVPEATAIELNSQLLEASFVIELGNWC